MVAFVKIHIALLSLVIRFTNGSIVVPWDWSDRIWNQIEYDSIVADFGQPIEDAVSYDAYLNLPPQSINKDGEINNFHYLCNSSKYVEWLQRRTLTGLLGDTMEGLDDDAYLNEELIHRALLVKDGKCSVDDKMRTAMHINSLYKDFSENRRNSWFRSQEGSSNFVKYLILYGDFSENEEDLMVSKPTSFHSKDTLPFIFVYVSPRAGAELTDLITSKSKRWNKIHPDDVGIKVILDSRRINSTYTDEKKGKTTTMDLIVVYSRPFFFALLVLILAASSLSRVRCRRNPVTGQLRVYYIPPPRVRFFTDNNDNDALNASVRSNTITKEDVLSLPEVIFSKYEKGYIDGSSPNAFAKLNQSIVNGGETKLDPEILGVEHGKYATSENVTILDVAETECKCSYDAEEDSINTLSREINIGSLLKDQKISAENELAKSCHDFKIKENSASVAEETTLKYGNSFVSSISCSICLDDFCEKERIRKLPCGHFFHTDCIIPWLTERQDFCPMCKEKVFGKT